jgi:hypothetical protein
LRLGTNIFEGFRLGFRSQFQMDIRKQNYFGWLPL